MWRVPSRPWLAWTAVFPVLVAACGGGTAPATPPKLADAARSVAQLRSVSAPTSTHLFRSFTFLAPYFFRTDSTPIIPVRALALPPLQRWSLPRTVPLPAPRSQGMSHGLGAAPSPPGTPGKTFGWDTPPKGYAPSTAPGPPATGRRSGAYPPPHGP